MTYPAVIIDDDKINIKLLSNLLSTYCPDIEVIHTATNVEEGIKILVQHKPQILFLDIEIHNKTAFDILNVIDTKSMQVILVTAYDKYAIQSYKYSILDYLLKPIKIEDLIAAVNRCKIKIQEALPLLKVEQESKNKKEFFSVHHKDHIMLIRTDDIIHLQAQGSYTEIDTVQKSKILSSRSLKENEELLPPHLFIRTHYSHIINVNFIDKYIKNKYGALLLKNGKEVPIAAARKKEITERLNM